MSLATVGNFLFGQLQMATLGFVMGAATILLIGLVIPYAVAVGVDHGFVSLAAFENGTLQQIWGIPQTVREGLWMAVWFGGLASFITVFIPKSLM